LRNLHNRRASTPGEKEAEAGIALTISGNWTEGRKEAREAHQTYYQLQKRQSRDAERDAIGGWASFHQSPHISAHPYQLLLPHLLFLSNFQARE